MIDNIIKSYNAVNNKARIKLIESVLGNENFFRHEVTFFDEGRVTAIIDNMREDYQKIATEINFVQKTSNDSDDSKAKLNFLYLRQLEIINAIAFQMSQQFDKIPQCLKLLDGLKMDLSLCLDGLQFYADGDFSKSRLKFDEYLSKHANFGDHYLLNKVYGNLEFDAENYSSAKFYFQKVTQICPEDIEVHRNLSVVYKKLGDTTALNVELNILKILEVR